MNTPVSCGLAPRTTSSPRPNGTRATPPQHGGIVVNGGQQIGGGRVLVERNVIADNRGAALLSRYDVNLERTEPR